MSLHRSATPMTRPGRRVFYLLLILLYWRSSTGDKLMRIMLVAFLAFTLGIALGLIFARPSVVHAQYGPTSVRITPVSSINMGPLGGVQSVMGAASVVGFSCTSDKDGTSECFIRSRRQRTFQTLPRSGPISPVIGTLHTFRGRGGYYPETAPTGCKARRTLKPIAPATNPASSHVFAIGSSATESPLTVVINIPPSACAR